MKISTSLLVIISVLVFINYSQCAKRFEMCAIDNGGPEFLKGINGFECTNVFINMLKFYGVDRIFFIDDKEKFFRSIRSGSYIYVNIRGTYWDSMILHPWECKTANEALALRMLHEVGHIYLKHSGDVSKDSTTQEIKQLGSKMTFWDNLTGREGEAWQFAFNFRNNEANKFNEIVDSINSICKEHIYHDKDWDDSAELQWKRINNNSDLPSDLWSLIPGEIKNKYFGN